MSRIGEWMRRLVHPREESAEAKARVDNDVAAIELHARRIENGVDALEHRVYTHNHISAAVEHLLKKAR